MTLIYVRIYDTHICARRYIWCNRVALARSVHDMVKQMYDNRQYSTPAWAPLREWLFDCEDEVSRERGEVLVKFNKSNTDFHHVVAKSLWNMATGPNTPWGRGATKPSVYREIPIHEKVIGGGRKPCPFFFCRVNFCGVIYVST